MTSSVLRYAFNVVFWLTFRYSCAFLGVYRVMYDPETWSLLIDQLMRNHTAIHFVNRAILIDDAFRLASIGHVKYTVPFRLIGYLGKEDQAHVWEVVLHHLYKIETDDVLPLEESQLLKVKWLLPISPLEA